MSSNADELPTSEGCSLRRDVISELLLSLKKCRAEKSRVQRKHQDLEMRIEQMALSAAQSSSDPPLTPTQQTPEAPESEPQQKPQVQPEETPVARQRNESRANEEGSSETRSEIETSLSISAWIDQVERASKDMGLTPRETLLFAEDVVQTPLVSRWLLTQDRFSAWTDLRDSLLKAFGANREPIKSVSESSVEILDRAGAIDKIELTHIEQDQVFLEDLVVETENYCEIETRNASPASIAISTGSSPENHSQRVSTPSSSSSRKEEIQLSNKVDFHSSRVVDSSHRTYDKVSQKLPENISRSGSSSAKLDITVFVDSMGRITPNQLRLTQSSSSEKNSAEELLRRLRLPDCQVTHKMVSVEGSRTKAGVYTDCFDVKVNLLRLDFLKRLSQDWRNLLVFKELEEALRRGQIWGLQRKICLRVSIDNFDYEIDFLIVPTKEMMETVVLEDPLSRLDKEEADSKAAAAAAFDKRFDIKGRSADFWWFK